MPRYLYRDTIALTIDATENVRPTFGRYDQTGYATNWFPDQYTLKTLPTYVQQEIPAPYGPARQPAPGATTTAG